MWRFNLVACAVMLVVMMSAPTPAGASLPLSFAPVPGSPLVTSASGYSIAVGDFNGDGKPDLAALVFRSGSSPLGTLSLFLGNGDGTFRQITDNLPTGPGIITSVAAGDFDGDGKVDLAVGNTTGSGNISGAVNILLGNGDGTFRAGPTTALGATLVRNLAAGDLKGDGKTDLVVSEEDRNGNNTVRALLNKGDGSFAATAPLSLGNRYVTSVSVRDLNGDGKGDLLALTGPTTYRNSGHTNVNVLLGNGDGTFRAASGSPITLDPNSGIPVVGDFDADGKPDLAVGSGTGFTILLGRGDGTFIPSGTTIEQDFRASPYTAGDFNGDGKADLVIANSYTVCAAGPNCGRADLNILLNTTGSAPNPFAPILPFADTPDHRFFKETGHSLNSGFLTYWQLHGGVSVFGYPISEEFTEQEGRGIPYSSGTVQYFERARFEYHPEFKGTPYEVELGLLGRNEVAALRTGEAPFQPIAAFTSTPEHRFFPDTGHSLNSGFLAYWQANGGLAIFGLPISEEFTEKNPDTGQVYTVQYFERQRFEYHPENKGTEYEVLLGRLGVQAARARGYLP